MPYEDYFRLKSELAKIDRKDFPISDPLLLDFESTSPLALIMGEYLTLDSNYKLARAANPGVPPGPWPLYMEKGRSDTQAFGEKRTMVLFMGGYWAETKVFTGTPTLGQALEVADISFAGGTRSGLQAHAAGTNPVIGYVTKLAADNGGWLQFQSSLY